MRQQRVTKSKKVTDKRSSPRDDEQKQERLEVRKDLRHWFEER